MYTLTDPDATPYTIPTFAITPSFCPISCEYEATMLELDGEEYSAIESFDAESLTFNFLSGDEINAALNTVIDDTLF